MSAEPSQSLALTAGVTMGMTSRLAIVERSRGLACGSGAEGAALVEPRNIRATAEGGD